MMGYVLQDIAYNQFRGHQFTMSDPNQVNLLLTLGVDFGILLLFVVSNWTFCVLMDGKATFKEIWIFTSYSLLPYILLHSAAIILSNVLTREEDIFLSFLTMVGIIWSLILLINGFINFHEYSLSKAIGSLTLTVLGMLLISFLIFLLYSLFQQVISNLLTIYNEILFRFRLSS
jgi:hypothetical protein